MLKQNINLQNYEKYLNGCSEKNLRQIASSIDPAKFPKRYQLVKKRLQEMSSATVQQSHQTNKETVTLNQLISPAVQSKKTIPWKYVLIPTLIFIIFNLSAMFFFQWDQIKYRPWVALPIFSILYLFFNGSMLLYGIQISKKVGFWPFVKNKPVDKILKEFFVSFGIMILISICIAIPVLLISLILKSTIGQHSFIQFASQVPNRPFVLFWLIMAFTILPVIEEIIFRGYLYNILKTKTSVAIACVIQAFLFALCHPYGFIGNFSIFLFGIALAIVYEKQGDLLRPIFIHCLRNALVLIPFLLISAGNLYSVADSHDEALVKPKWFLSSPPEYIEKKSTAEEQYNYAIETWGTKGSKQFKKEAMAFSAVSTWFPEDKKEICKAELGIVAIYYALGDYWRSISKANELRTHFNEQRESCATAFSYKAWAYYMLKEFEKSHKAFTEILKIYPDNKNAVESAQKGLRWLKVVSPGAN